MKTNLLTIFIILTAFQISIYGQTFTKNNFVIYGEVINELKSSKNLVELKNKYDYVFILLLDSTNIDLIRKTEYQYIDEFRNYVSGLSFSKRTLKFVTDKQEIKDVFKDESTLKRIITSTNSNNSSDIPMTKFDYPVYIKGQTAIFKTSGPTWTNTYFARLQKGILQINWLGGIVE